MEPVKLREILEATRPKLVEALGALDACNEYLVAAQLGHALTLLDERLADFVGADEEGGHADRT